MHFKKQNNYDYDDYDYYYYYQIKRKMIVIALPSNCLYCYCCCCCWSCLYVFPPFFPVLKYSFSRKLNCSYKLCTSFHLFLLLILLIRIINVIFPPALDLDYFHSQQQRQHQNQQQCYYYSSDFFHFCFPKYYQLHQPFNNQKNLSFKTFNRIPRFLNQFLYY